MSPDQGNDTPLPNRLTALKCGTEREEAFRDLSLCMAEIFGMFISWFAMNGLPMPGVIAQGIDEESGKANDALTKLEKGAVIFAPKFDT